MSPRPCPLPLLVITLALVAGCARPTLPPAPTVTAASTFTAVVAPTVPVATPTRNPNLRPIVTATDLTPPSPTPSPAGPPHSPFSITPFPTVADGSLVIMALSFVDAHTGWALAYLRDRLDWVALLHTEDGGQHWQFLPAPQGVYYPEQSSPAAPSLFDLLFTSPRDGFITGAQDFVTHDGGHTWQPTGPSAPAGPIVRFGAQLFQLQSDACPVPIESPWQACTYNVWSSPDGDTWQPTDLTVRGASVRLVAGDATTAWLLYHSPSADGFDLIGHLLRTQDGGQTWQALPDLPVAPIGLHTGYSGFSAIDANTVWLATSADYGAGSGAASLYQSNDGGLSWDLRASANPAGAVYTGTMPGRLIASTLTGVTAELAFGGLIRGGFFQTSDGGRNWNESVPTALIYAGDSPVSAIDFLDAEHGWVASPSGLFITTDGGANWQMVTAPDFPGQPPAPTPTPRPKTPVPIATHAYP
jgi:photosystem II stability/assembly factor-like uncharacterized protein